MSDIVVGINWANRVDESGRTWYAWVGNYRLTLSWSQSNDEWIGHIDLIWPDNHLTLLYRQAFDPIFNNDPAYMLKTMETEMMVILHRSWVSSTRANTNLENQRKAMSQ